MTPKSFVQPNLKKKHLLIRLLISFSKILQLVQYPANIFTCPYCLSVQSFCSISNLFFMKASKDFSDGHLWYSVISRPPSSTFTRVQRVSCCFSLLLCTMLTSIMFYGIPSDPSEQTMDLGTAFIHFILSWVEKRNRVMGKFGPFTELNSCSLQLSLRFAW